MRIVKFALPVLFIVALALFLTRVHLEGQDKAERSLAVEHARAQFFQRSAVVRGAPTAEAYRAELKQLLRAWFAEETDLGNKWPELRGQAAPFTPPAPRVKGGELREFQDFADQVVGAWREGKFDLLESAAAAGLRVDLLKVAKSGAGLAADFAVWGAPQEIEIEETRDHRQTTRATVPLSFRGLTLKFHDAEGKLIAEMPGEGEPSLRLDLPERLVHDAPPGLVLARYEPGLFPREAATIEWTLTAQVRTPTGEQRPIVASFKTKSDGAWELAEGQAWGGKERTASKEEIAGKKQQAQR